MKRGPFAFVMLVVVGLSLFTMVGCGQPVAATSTSTEKSKDAKRSARPAPPLSPDQAEPYTEPRTTTQPARIESFEQTPLYAKIDGYVRKVRTVTGPDGQPIENPIADIGDRVQENDVLAELWVPEMDEELRQKEALLAQSKAELEQAAQAVVVAEMAHEMAKTRVGEFEAGVIRADGEYQRWKAELARMEELAAGRAISEKLVDETLNQFRAAEAAKGEAAARIRSAKTAVRETEAVVAKAKADQAVGRARVAVTKCGLDRMQALLGYAKIRAPFAGVVTQRNVDTGHFVWPPRGDATPLFVVQRIDTLRCVVEVPELEAPLIEVGSRAFIRVQALGPEEIEGKVTRTAWVLDETVRTLRIEIDLANPDGRLRPGMYATARIVLRPPDYASHEDNQ